MARYPLKATLLAAPFFFPMVGVLLFEFPRWPVLFLSMPARLPHRPSSPTARPSHNSSSPAASPPHRSSSASARSRCHFSPPLARPPSHSSASSTWPPSGAASLRTVAPDLQRHEMEWRQKGRITGLHQCQRRRQRMDGVTRLGTTV